jgi:hypothetical protein
MFTELESVVGGNLPIDVRAYLTTLATKLTTLTPWEVIPPSQSPRQPVKTTWSSCPVEKACSWCPA